jgi:hypothetical protein
MSLHGAVGGAQRVACLLKASHDLIPERLFESCSLSPLIAICV